MQIFGHVLLFKVDEILEKDSAWILRGLGITLDMWIGKSK